MLVTTLTYLRRVLCKIWEEIALMDLMDKLASLAQRYEELNNLMGQPEVLSDISLLQRYGREHAELEDVVHKYNEIINTDKESADAQEMYDSEEGEIREMAFEEL